MRVSLMSGYHGGPDTQPDTRPKAQTDSQSDTQPDIQQNIDPEEKGKFSNIYSTTRGQTVQC